MITWIKSTKGKWHIVEKDGSYACNKAVRINLNVKTKVGPNQVALPDHDCCWNCIIKYIL